MAFINGEEILFSPVVNISPDIAEKEDLESIKKAIIARGGNIVDDASIDDIPSAILEIPVGDSTYIEVVDSNGAYEKQILPGALEYALINSVGETVTKVESVGANLIPFPYKANGETHGAGYSVTKNGVTYTVRADGGIHKKGTATAYSMFLITHKADSIDFEAGKVYRKYPGVVITYRDAATGENNNYWYGDLIYWHSDYSVNNVYIATQEGATVDEIVYPMISCGEYEFSYGRYHAEPIDSIDIPSRDNLIKIEGGCLLRFVNDANKSVANKITYIRRLT